MSCEHPVIIIGTTLGDAAAYGDMAGLKHVFPISPRTPERARGRTARAVLVTPSAVAAARRAGGTERLYQTVIESLASNVGHDIWCE